MDEWFLCIVLLQVCADFTEVVSVFIMRMAQPLSRGLMTMNWIFLRLFNIAFSCNVKLL